MMARTVQRPEWQKPGGSQFLRDVPGTPYRIMNWHSFQVVTGPGKGPFFFNEIEIRRQENRSNIIVVTGPPGEGKSYCALRLAEIFDPKFDVNEQVVFERHHLLRLIGPDSPLKRGQVIVVDEAQYVAGARRWYEEIQKDVMENIEAVRSRGYIIIIVALHLNLLDIIIRKYVLSHMIHLEERGRGTVYRLYTPRFAHDMYRYRLGTLKLGLPDAEKCASVNPDCLVCRFRNECMTKRAIYERRKREFLNKKAKEGEEKAVRREARKLSDEEIVELLRQHRDEFTDDAFTTRGTLDFNFIRTILHKHHRLNISFTRAVGIRKLYEMMYPKEAKR